MGLWFIDCNGTLVIVVWAPTPLMTHIEVNNSKSVVTQCQTHVFIG